MMLPLLNKKIIKEKYKINGYILNRTNSFTRRSYGGNCKNNYKIKKNIK